MSKDYKEIWDTLNKVSMDKIKDKKGRFDYLSWTDMWQEIHKYFPEVDYEFKEFDNPVHGTMDCMVYPNGSASVHCTVTIKGVSRSMWLAITDHNNNAKKVWDVTDVANTKMRCLTKCISMFGLGAHVYRGEELEDREEPKKDDSSKEKEEMPVVEDKPKAKPKAKAKPKKEEIVEETEETEEDTLLFNDKPWTPEFFIDSLKSSLKAFPPESVESFNEMINDTDKEDEKKAGVNKTQIKMVKEHDPEAYQELIKFLTEKKEELLEETEEGGEND